VNGAQGPQGEGRLIKVPAGAVTLEGILGIPETARGVVVFAHGSGSSRHSPRNRFVARVLREAKFATVLIDLLTSQEERVDAVTGHLRFDTGLLGERLLFITDWLRAYPDTHSLPIGYFGASTGAAAALIAAARRPDVVGAVVSRGGRPDLAQVAIPGVRAPTLLIVGEFDRTVLEMNREALQGLRAERELAVVPGATHLFEEAGALEEVARLAKEWFVRYLESRPVQRQAHTAG
jgi:pimeloyl-ACP methyl ester carboxylesterase